MIITEYMLVEQNIYKTKNTCVVFILICERIINRNPVSFFTLCMNFLYTGLDKRFEILIYDVIDVVI